MADNFKTIILLGVLSIFLVILGGWLGGRSGLYIGVIISAVLNIFTYFFSDKIALSSSGAKPISQTKAPKLYEIVRKLTQKMNVPMPKLYLIPTSQANAFATGRNPEHASVAVTEGILNILSDEELEGVLAHELSHVKNRDILIATVAATLASAITLISRIGMYGGAGDRENKNNGALGIVLAILAPIAAMLIQLALSRTREFEADESGAETVRNGNYLASALVKIHNSVARTPLNINPAFSSLYIENPMSSFGGQLAKLFSTHPPTEERIRRLENMHFRSK